MYLKAYRTHSDNYIKYLNYINGGSFFESVEEPIGGTFKIYTEDDSDPDPDVSKAEDDEDPEVSADKDEDDPTVSTSDDDEASDNDSSDSDTNDTSDDNSNDNNDDSSDDGDDSPSDNRDSDTNDDGPNDSNSGSDDGGSDDDYDDEDDMDSDPHGMSDDDEDPEAGSDDDSDDSDDSSSDDDKKDDKPGTDFENMRRYNLYKKFMALKDSIDSYTDTLDALVYDDDELNSTTKLVSSKLKKLGEITYDYMTMKFENDTYTQALLFYHQVNAGIRMSFDLLESGNNNIRKRP